METGRCQLCNKTKTTLVRVGRRIAWGAAAYNKPNGGYSRHVERWCLDCRKRNSGAYKLEKNFIDW